MNDKITKFQEARIILALMRHVGEKGDVEFKNGELGSDLGAIVSNGNYMDAYLYDLDEAGVLNYEEIGEDGFAPIIMCSVSAATHLYLQGLIEGLEDESDSLKRRITEILSFNPDQLTKSIADTQAKLEEVAGHIQSNELLKPMERPLREIRHHFQSISAVSARYEDVYKNIIRPVQEAGAAGVKATVKWAISGILISTAVSLAITNWGELRVLLFGA